MTAWTILQSGDLWLKLSEQLYLVGVSICFAILIGLPLGLLAMTFPKLRRCILGGSAVLWTIPSLALFACLMPLTGIGMTTAIIGLTGYALLPIVRSTVDGMMRLSHDLHEASNALGLGFYQHLLFINMPLAMPTIVSGIKVAMVMCVGMATLATFIGAGGLGDFINQGLATSNYMLVLKGAIPSAILAIGLDSLMARIEKRSGQTPHVFQAYGLLGCIMGLALFLCLPWLGYQAASHHGKPTLIFASKSFTEQYVLVEMMAQMVEHHLDFKVERKFNLGTTDICHQALQSKSIDLYPEYTGTAYITVMKKPHTLKSAEELFHSVAQYYQQHYGLRWLTPFNFNNSNALVTKRSWSDKHHVKTITDLLKISSLRIAGPPEAIKRSDSLPGLQKFYGLQFATVKHLLPPMSYQALQQGAVDVIIGFTNDSELQRAYWQVLEDDRKFFMAYQAAPVVHADVLVDYPKLEGVLAMLSQRIDTQVIRQLNARVELDQQGLKKVVRDYLLAERLIT